jgi:hypothetical protein
MEGATMTFMESVRGFYNLIFRHEVLSMSNILPEDSGIRGAVLWMNPGTVEGKKLKHGPRIKVTPHGCSKSTVCVIAKPPRFIGKKLPAEIEKDVTAFVLQNYNLLMDFWNNKMGSKAFLNTIKPI